MPKQNKKDFLNESPQSIQNANQQTRLNEKWGHEAIKAGWTAIPSIILERQQSLGLNAMDLAIIMHLVRHWWESDRHPYPSKRRICEAMGINESTMRKHIAKLEKAKLIQRNPKHHAGSKGIATNEYDLSGLVKRSKKLAQEALEVRKETEIRKSHLRRIKVKSKE